MVEVCGRLHAPTTFSSGMNAGTVIIGSWVAPEPVWAFWRRETLLTSAGIRNAGCPTSAQSLSQRHYHGLLCKWVSLSNDTWYTVPRPTQPPVQWTPSLFHGVKAAGAWPWAAISFWLCGCVWLELYLYSDWLRAAQSGIEYRWGRDFPPVQTGPGAHPAFCKMGTGSFLGVKCGRGVLLTTHPLLVPRSWKSRAIPLPTLWATLGL